ncbi:unnamed protein product (macronuclear) [Paramecium tetraurelia]|uniref:Uncharacterized protein n=1 Tax=Paramecium tetraurelia TaxID=5888 RepID=A0DU00_PARTE|nr:uncharacterized protein GSPATT00020201001 [Paramecium tetraurelia]CAK86517.1 unnamed protein product [Paramecium tetraurelia]|eukprot:XP_001453914.1 hypothetical protein (macronuclear) [Paramecium tetraurelia strain d4-2]
MESKKLSKIIEFIFLSITRQDLQCPAQQGMTLISLCVFFCYYLWISRNDKANTLMVFNHSLSNVVNGFEWNPNLGRSNLAIIYRIHLDSN